MATSNAIKLNLYAKMPAPYSSQRALTSIVRSIAAIVLSSVLLLTGCTSLIPFVVSENDRDVYGQFDGTWTLQLNDVDDKCKSNFVNRTYMTVKSGIGNVMGATGNISRVGAYSMKNSYWFSSGRATITFSGDLIKESGHVKVSYPGNLTTDCIRSLTVTRV